jgi:hypothetical protein
MTAIISLFAINRDKIWRCGKLKFYNKAILPPCEFGCFSQCGRNIGPSY